MVWKARGNGKEEREACVREWEGMGKVKSVFELWRGLERKWRKGNKYLGMRG